ncbi:MAG: SGNH/GDSL hydrolase family protein [Bryobacteraceae bacterium]
MKAIYPAPFLCAILLSVAALPGQDTALLANRESLQLFRRLVQLMEATTIAMPELARAGAPVLENSRQALNTLESAAGQQHSGLTLRFLENVRAYLALAGAVPKPFPFPEEARRQFGELRDSADRVESHFRALLDRKESQLRSPDRDNLARYAEANARLGPPAAGRNRVVFLGDSITDGWRLNEYFTGRDFVNRGISGQITAQMLGRMKADVIDLKPEAVLVLAGTNDLARGVPLGAIQNNLAMIADLAEAHKIKPLLASVLPISDHHQSRNPQNRRSEARPPAKILELNRWIENFCRQRNYTYVNYFPHMIDQAGFLRAELADDGLHPNAAGYRIMAPVAESAIKKTVAGTKR